MAASAPREAEGVRVTPRGGLRLRPWLGRHVQTFVASLGRLARAPFGTLMTGAVIGLALALPAGLYAALENVREVSGAWDAGREISVFLDPAAGDEAARALAEELARWPQVSAVRVITRAQALEEFRDRSGFADVMDAFAEQNPLPAVVLVTPRDEASGPAAVESLLARLTGLPRVDAAQFDLEWLRRLEAFVAVVERGVLLLGVLLAGGVVLVVGNTMRLAIDNRREEIEIAKLFGATDAFIRRPFLYAGLLYGFLGGCVAWLVLAGAFALLAEPVARLAALYAGDYRLAGLGGAEVAWLLGGGGALGLLGSWLSVGRHLASIEPT